MASNCAPAEGEPAQGIAEKPTDLLNAVQFVLLLFLGSDNREEQVCFARLACTCKSARALATDLTTASCALTEDSLRAHIFDWTPMGELSVI